MRRVKFGLGGMLMLSAMAISDNVWVIVIYLAAALFHELGHLAAARLLCIPVKEIRFEFSGVRICTDTGLTSYRQEILLSLAGPLVNLILAALSFFAVGAERSFGTLLSLGMELLSGGEISVANSLGFFALSSLIQALTNLLPVNSFDGGRILYCLTALLWGELVADRILSVTSVASALLLWTVALYLMLRISAGLGIYVFAACVFFSLR